MYILLNNEPLDILKINGISGVITLDSRYYVECRKNLQTIRANGLVDVYRMKMPKKLLTMSAKDIEYDAVGNNTVWGYFFYIAEKVSMERITNDCPNGMIETVKNIYYRVYDNKTVAQGVLENLIIKINEVDNKDLLEWRFSRMQDESYKSDGITYVRINRTKAKRYYAQGKTIYLIPNFMRLENAWVGLMAININDNPEDKQDFDKRLNSYIYYNCYNSKGKSYPKYFIKQKDL